MYLIHTKQQKADPQEKEQYTREKNILPGDKKEVNW